jgi:hypothetical protein
MKTYLVVWFNSDGGRSSEITERLLSMGFRPVRGNFDYVYDWGSNVGVDEAIRIGDQVHETLKGCNVSFKIETV